MFRKRSWTTRLAALMAMAVLVAATGMPAVGQESTGTIEGVVTDESHAVIAGATVTVTSKKTGRSLTVTTTGAGVYVVRALQPGEYEIKAEASGFKSNLREVVVRVGAATTGDVTLEVGSPNEIVTVQAESEAQVNKVENKVYDVITERQIEGLPLNGRNFLDLAQLSPGVQIVDGGTFDPTKNQFTGISVGGRSGRVTRIQIDGIDISDETVGTTTQNISQDALQEFQLSQSSLDPSTSLTSTGAVNIVTKSGGNNIHGDGFFFYRDEEVAAAPVTFTGIRRIDQDLRSAEFDREQGGFNVGGPFVKDRAFWFVNFEKSNQDATTFTRPSNFPNLAGAVTTPFNENMALGRFDWNVNDNVRLFYRFSHNSNDAATGFGGSTTCCAPFVNDNNTNVHALGLDATKGRFSHSFRYGFTDFDNQIFPETLGLPFFTASNGIPVSVSLNTRRELYTGPNRLAPQSTFQRNQQFKYDGGVVRGGHSFRYGGEVNYVQVNVFAAFFGVGPEVRATFSDAARAAIIARGDDPFDPLQYPVSFVIVGNGRGAFSEIDNIGRGSGGINNTRLSWYVQDSWRLRPNFTLNLGLKYEVDTGQVNDDLTAPAFLEQVIGPGQSQPTKLDKNNFGPQIGFAWDPSGAGKTVIRGGAGYFYETQIFNNSLFDRTDKLPAGLGFNTATPPLSNIDAQGRLLDSLGRPVSNIDTRTLVGRPIGAVINQLGELQGAFQSAEQSIPFDPNGVQLLDLSRHPFQAIFNRNFKSPMALQTNIGVQHELKPGTLVTVDWVRNWATHTNIIRDYNRFRAADTLDVAGARALRDARLTANGFLPGIAGVNQAIAAGRTGIFGGFGSLFSGQFPPSEVDSNFSVIDTSGVSEYNALQVRFTSRVGDVGGFLRNVLLDASYSLSRFNGIAIDQDFLSTSQFNDDFLNSRNFGPTTLDRTHQFSVNTTADLPWGFNVSAISAVRSALPATPFLTTALGGNDEIFFSDLDGDGTVNDFLPGAGRGAFGRSIGGVSDLNGLISSFNSQAAGTLTPAGQALVGAGVFTEAQLRALGFVIPSIDLAPADQVENDSFITTDVRVSKAIKLSENVTIRPLVEVFNLFNVSNFAVLSGELGGSAGQINGTPPGARSNKLGLGSGSFSQGLARSVQFGVRVSF